MKQFFALVLALVMCLSLCACKAKQDGDPTTASPTSGTDSGVGADIDGLLQGTDIDVAKFREYAEIVELTTENWKEYFKAYRYSYRYDEEKVERDDFGEITSTETITHSGEGYAFGAGNERYHWYDDVVIELQHKQTGELSVYKFGPYEEANDLSVEESFSLDNYECTRIKGRIYYFNLPMGALPVSTYIWPMLQEGIGMPPGALFVCPGTNAVTNTYMADWFS